MLTLTRPTNLEEVASMSLPAVLLRTEGAALLALTVFGYERYGRSWWLFLILLLVPDVGMVGYLANPRLGAFTYNLMHTYLGPAVLIVVGIAGSSTIALSIGLIWFAHIGMDRLLGYGLKYPTNFKDTHLQRV
jgi:Domain of unknown function (DUF4260)